MLKNLTINNFRCFKHFELQQLGRVNLLVGKNNSGKTSILEAIQLLCSKGNPEPLLDAMTNRGEYFWSDESRRSGRDRQLDICHLFHGHEIESGSEFSIVGLNDDFQNKLSVSIGKRPIASSANSEIESDKSTSFVEDFPDNLIELVFNISWTDGNHREGLKRTLSANGGLSEDYIRRWRVIGKPSKNAAKNQYITSSSLTTTNMTELFEQVVLTPEETLVYQALQTIEPKIQRLASITSGSRRTSESRGGFVVRLADNDQRVPIGSMGDGIWRMLGLALSTVSAKGGVLLVDEIDTGLHFTAMEDMWKLLLETAKKLNVQVFATTHNSDCWTSLASIASQEQDTEDGITIQRIEPGKETGVVFTEREMVIAAQRGIEVR
ncbi:MAG: AAA family ATPase [Coleofasciculus sp. B1-GNL1-01]|uniref:AAA family ATPase n=1 Tax=Coleofasciculus sp. B1-GNL1-01 TaxID=3068484 RepID=UPI0032F949B5